MDTVKGAHKWDSSVPPFQYLYIGLLFSIWLIKMTFLGWLFISKYDTGINIYKL